MMIRASLGIPVVTAVSMVAIAACAPMGGGSAHADDQAAASPVQELLAGTTEYGTVPDNGGTYAYFRDEQGRIAGQRTGDWGDDSDTGAWSVSDDGVTCVTWSDWDDEQRQCWRVTVQDSAIRFQAVSGTDHSYDLPRDRLVDGNPEDH